MLLLVDCGATSETFTLLPEAARLASELFSWAEDSLMRDLTGLHTRQPWALQRAKWERTCLEGVQ